MGMQEDANQGRVQPFSSSEVLSLPAQNQANQEVIKWQLDLQNTLQDIENKLGGMERHWDPETRRFVFRKERHELLNEEGIGRVMTIIRTVMTTNTVLSCYDKREANIVIIDVSCTVADLLYMEWQNFAVKKHNLSSIIRIVENGIKPTLYRAVDGHTMDYLRGTVKNLTTVIEKPPEMGNSVFSRIGRFMKGGY